MDSYDTYQQTNSYYGGSHEESQQAQIEHLKAEVESLKTEVQQYKTVSQSFEKRVLDLHMELMKKDEEIAHLKEQNLAVKDADHNAEDVDSEILRKLFVGGLNFSTTDEMLREYFSQFGTVQECTVMRDTATKKSRGFGFVVFTTATALDAAQAARPHSIDSRDVDTKRAMPRGEAAKKQPGILAKKIFIGGLKTTTEEDVLREYFTQFGTVDSVDVLEDKATKRKRGFAYVTFTDNDPVDKAVLQKFHMIDGRRCEVKKAFTREEMKNKNGFMPGPFMPGPMGNFMGNAGGNMGAGGFGPRNNMGGNFGGGPACGSGMGGNHCGHCNHMGGGGGGGGGGGNFGGGCGNMGCGFAAHGGNCGPGGNRGGNVDNMGSPTGWGPGNDGAGGNMGGGNNSGGGWNQNGGGWNQGTGEAGQGGMGMNWNSNAFGNSPGNNMAAGKSGGTGKPMRNTYTQRGAGPYGGGYGIQNVDQTMLHDGSSVRK